MHLRWQAPFLCKCRQLKAGSHLDCPLHSTVWPLWCSKTSVFPDSSRRRQFVLVQGAWWRMGVPAKWKTDNSMEHTAYITWCSMTSSMSPFFAAIPQKHGFFRAVFRRCPAWWRGMPTSTSTSRPPWRPSLQSTSWCFEVVMVGDGENDEFNDGKNGWKWWVQCWNDYC